MPNKKKDVNMNDLRKLVAAYNKSTCIKIYRNSNRDDLIRKLANKNYEPKKSKGKQILNPIKPMKRNTVIKK